MKTKIRFHHFHDGNDPWVEDKDGGLVRVRGSASYATFAALVDLDTGNVLEEVSSFCNPKDNPTRPKGREITLGRLFKTIAEKSVGAPKGDRVPSEALAIKNKVARWKALWANRKWPTLYAELEAPYLPKSSVCNLL